MRTTDIKQKINQGEVSLGSWLTIGSTTIAEIMCNTGLDWLVVDLEHSYISIAQAGQIIGTINATGVTSIVRLPSNDSALAKRLLDAGAQGIIIPNVTDAEEARSAVAATRYPPDGNRGVGLGRAQKYGRGFQDYFDWQKSGPIVWVQIEDQKALNNLAEIFSTDGVDGFLVGPYDLSCSLGVPGDFGHPKFKEAIDAIRESGQIHGCPAGYHLVEPEPDKLATLVDDGFTVIAYSVDMRIIDVGVDSGIQAVKRLRTE